MKPVPGSLRLRIDVKQDIVIDHMGQTMRLSFARELTDFGIKWFIFIKSPLDFKVTREKNAFSTPSFPP